MSSHGTYGYREDAGTWSIDLGLLDPTSPQSMTEAADEAAAAFLDAFAAVCAVEYSEGDIAELGDDGQFVALRAETPLQQREKGRFRPAEASSIGDVSGRAFLSRVMLRCGVIIVNGGAGNQSTIIHGGLYFHYESGVNGLIGEPANFDSAYVMVDVEADPWLDATLHDGEVLDNRHVATLNRPRLESALRRLEERLGRPISYVSSNPFPTLVDHYGFKPGIEPYLK